jgi:hypothetical protein
MEMRVCLGKGILIILLLCLSNAALSDGLERVKYNHPGLTVDLGVGLWAWPLPMDYDEDGDYDLVVACPDKPYNGIYFFENPGGDSKMPIFKPAVRLGGGGSNIQLSYIRENVRILRPAVELVDFRQTSFKEEKEIYPDNNVHSSKGRVRANQWKYCDYDGDGQLDLIVGVGDWAQYGWDFAFNRDGRWMRGPLHGYVYLIRNKGTTTNPDYEEPTKVMAGGEEVDVYGMPSPNFADFDGDGDLDLLCGEFVDSFNYFENVGDRYDPKYRAVRKLALGDEILTMDLCMIVPVGLDWDRDGDIDLVVGQEDGRVAFVENTGKTIDGLPQFLSPRFFRQEAVDVKFGALVTPFSVDWDDDGDEDIIAGNTAGYIGIIENLDGGEPPKWAEPRYLKSDGQEIRIMAGPNGSIQGPCEAKWGYTTLNVADWDHDGRHDLVVNSIWGKVIWYRNIGSQGKPEFGAAQPVDVLWSGKPIKPAWNWWDPEANDLATQWRTTPVIVDLNSDGLNDLIMLDHEGFLAFFERRRKAIGLELLPSRRVFLASEAGAVFDNRHSPTRFDMNGDGINDLVLVESDGSPLFVHRNEARDLILRSPRRVVATPDELDVLSPTRDAENFLRLNAGFAGRSGRRKIAVADWDGDGRRDLLVNSQNVNFLRCVSDRNDRYVFQDLGPVDDRILAGHTTSPTTVDWDKNGVPDLLVGAEDGFLYYLKNPRTAGKQ